MRCPVCGHWVEDADYWYGDKCLRCALKAEQADVRGKFQPTAAALRRETV